MKFDVGDRVAVYGHPSAGGNTIRGEVVDLGSELKEFKDWLVVRHEGLDLYCHPKQCRRLVKPERRRVWLHCFNGGHYKLTKDNHPEGRPCAYCREFVEVRKK